MQKPAEKWDHRCTIFFPDTIQVCRYMDVDFKQEVIANKMRSRVDTIVSNQQYAKRSSVSTTDALLQLTDDWTEVLDQDEPVKFVQNA